MALLAAVIVLAAFPPTFYTEGLPALDAKQYQAAADAFNKAIASDPNDFTAHFNLALADSLLNKDTEAIAEYRKALEIKPNLYQADLNLGIVLLRNKQASEALTHLLAAVEKKPKEFRPNLHLAEALQVQATYPKAEELYRTALELDKDARGRKSLSVIKRRACRPTNPSASISKGSPSRRSTATRPPHSSTKPPSSSKRALRFLRPVR